MTTNDAPFRFTQEGNLSILTLLPELNNVQWGEIDAIGTQVLSSLESQAHPLLIVDLSPLSYMGSAMVALIVRAWKATQPKKGKICVICPHAGVKEVLKLAALDKVWDIVDDMDEARALVGASRSSGSSGGSGSSSGVGLWIIGLILLIACGALVAFAVKPELLGMKSEKGKAPATQTKTEPETKTETDNTDSDSKNPETPSEPSIEKNATDKTDKPDASTKQPTVEKPASKETTPEKKETKKTESPKKEQADKKPTETKKKEAEPVKKEEAQSKEEKPPTKPEVKSEPKPESKPTPKTKTESK